MKPVRLLESLPPGLGHLRRGFRGASAVPLTFFGTWLLVLLARMRTIRDAAVRGNTEDVVALAFLVLFPLLLVWLSHLHLKRSVSPPPREGMGTWALAWRAFKKRPRGVWGLILLGFVYMVAFLCPVLAPYDPLYQPEDTRAGQFLPPGATRYIFGDTQGGELLGASFRVENGRFYLHRGFTTRSNETIVRELPLERLGVPKRGWNAPGYMVRSMQIAGRNVPYRVEYHVLGTDTIGRDVLSRMIYGSRISLTIGFAAMAVAVTLGTFFGAFAGFFGGWVDGAIMRLVDVLLAFPRLLLLLLIISIWQGAGIFTVVIVLGATGWMGVSRLVRAQVLQLKQLDFTAAARAMGFSQMRIVFRHMIPNAMAPVIVAGTLMVGGTILVESALSFLGMGVRPPTPTWGNIVNDGSNALNNAPWIATIPGLAIVLTVVSFNLVGDALRDAMDPRQRF